MTRGVPSCCMFELERLILRTSTQIESSTQSSKPFHRQDNNYAIRSKERFILFRGDFVNEGSTGPRRFWAPTVFSTRHADHGLAIRIAQSDCINGNMKFERVRYRKRAVFSGTFETFIFSSNSPMGTTLGTSVNNVTRTFESMSAPARKG